MQGLELAVYIADDVERAGQQGAGTQTGTVSAL
jgi:hypothetical protein